MTNQSHRITQLLLHSHSPPFPLNSWVLCFDFYPAVLFSSYNANVSYQYLEDFLCAWSGHCREPQFCSFLSSLYAFNSFPHFTCLVRTCSTMLSKTVRVDIFALLLILWESIYFTVSVTLAAPLLPFIGLRNFLSIPSLLRVCSMSRCSVFSKDFPTSIEMTMGLFHSVNTVYYFDGWNKSHLVTMYYCL